MTRVCACGCGKEPRSGSKYADYERCRQRAYKRKVEAKAEAAGIPAHLSLSRLDSVNGSDSRRGDAQTRRTAGQARRKREGLSVYFPTLDAAEVAFGTLVDAGMEAGHPATASLARAIDRRKARA